MTVDVNGKRVLAVHLIVPFVFSGQTFLSGGWIVCTSPRQAFTNRNFTLTFRTQPVHEF